ncbi:MAG TPA: hypothetical protein ENN21_01465 [Spirochaetes bacterium]|mgnify:CR=1 FL=1|nr:hypothetical protein [Spirochaetota bacterium]
MKKYAVYAAVLIALSGCASLLKQDGHRAHVVLSPNFDRSRHKAVAVLPFKQKGKTGHDEALSDEFSMELMAMGFVVVERDRLESAMKDSDIPMDGSVSLDKLKKISELLELDCMVIGSVYYATIPSSVNVESGKSIYDIQKIALRFVDMKTGEVLISASCTPVFGGTMIKEIGIKLRQMIGAGKTVPAQ